MPTISTRSKSLPPALLQHAPSPLWVISLFVGLAEGVSGVAVIRTTGTVQGCLTAFVIAFPIFIALAFFWLLARNPVFFYPPWAFAGLDIEKIGDLYLRFRPVAKTEDLKDEAEKIGEPDNFRLLFQVVGKNFKKSTKAMDVGIGCVVQVSTKELSADGTVSVGEAVTFVPDVKIVNDASGGGAHLSPRS